MFHAVQNILKIYISAYVNKMPILKRQKSLVRIPSYRLSQYCIFDKKKYICMGKVSYQSSVQFMQLPEQMMTQITDASKRLANGGNDYRQWSVNLVKFIASWIRGARLCNHQTVINISRDQYGIHSLQLLFVSVMASRITDNLIVYSSACSQWGSSLYR